MDSDEMERVVRNLDLRVEQVEQILPTLVTADDLQAAIEPLATRVELQAAIEPLATRVELRAAIADAVEPLATKAEMHVAIADAVEPLATKAEMHVAIADAVEPLATKDSLDELEQRMRTHFDVATESLRDDVRLIATAVATLSQQVDHNHRKLEADIAGLDRRLMRVEAGQAQH